MSEKLSLEELERQLYEREKPTLPPEERPQLNVEPPRFPPEPPPRGLSFRSQRRFSWWLMAVVALAAIIAFFIFWRGFSAFSKSRVGLEIDYPERIVAGETVEWRVSVKNNNRTALEEGELTFQFPEGAFNPESDRAVSRETQTIGRLEPGGSAEATFSAVVIGGEGFEREAVASLRFKPAGSSLTLQNQEKSAITVERFPVEVSLTGPEKVLSGERVAVGLQLTNEGKRTFKNLRLRIEYPSGFSFEKSKEPLSDFNAIWSIGDILPREERTNEITGIVSGLEGEGKIFRTFVEYRELSGWQSYKEVAFRADVARPPLNLSIRLFEEKNGAVSLASPLTYEVAWRNNTDVPVTGLTLTANLEGVLFDRTGLSASGEISASTIRWTQAQAPTLGALRPGEDGSVTFRLNTKDSFVSGSRNSTLKISVRLEATGLELIQIHETKVNGELNLNVSASQSGPSTFTIRWRLAALANDFKNVRVKTILPSDVSWSGGGVSYDDKTREVLWEVGNINAGQTLEKTFSVSSNSPTLTSETELTGEDIFTGNRVLKIEQPVEIRL